MHQLVSTVRGQLSDGVSTIAALRALFPPGSMTGAPKLRTMEIIREIESTPRGAYAGAFGWLSGDGRADLGVVIRTLLTRGDGSYLLGTGGGITVQSDGGVRRDLLEGRTAPRVAYRSSMTDASASEGCAALHRGGAQVALGQWLS